MDTSGDCTMKHRTRLDGSDYVFIKGKYYIPFERHSSRGRYTIYGIGRTLENAQINLRMKLEKTIKSS